ncbi:hemagglutinin repeat-containing protein [Acinetobacter gyllenbergii]|uniref:hemagglutinin repeat-containing protein n=1 Tax=Acinetobacter gyllenbergii TaxID=134534 RepID=UPI003F55B0B6
MNKNRYRVIFSQARGMFIAVAEVVKSRTKTAGQSIAEGTETVTNSFTPNSYKKLNPLHFSVVMLLGAVVYTIPLASIANTQIHADKSAPNNQQPQIHNSANGTVQVNIQTPSAGGVSRNTYSQFDVGQQGAILNNSRNNVQTQIGGWVQGNANLARGEAKVILNEVNSSNPSQLKGYLEVAGKSAQVVIANPSGLVCDGCGVINADRFTLTTGQAVMNQGYLESFRVREGQVSIEGKGLNGSLTPYTDIYARALKVNAGLYADELNTVLGQNDIQVKDQTQAKVTAISTSNNTNTNNTAPSSNFALDVGQLGGMYAGKIYLVGTEQGLGVRNAGSMNATTGQLSLNANGDLINTGNIIANKDQIAIQAQNIKNSGNISSTQHKIQITTDNIQNSGLIATNDEIQLNAQGKIDNNSGVINAGRIDFTAQNLSNDKGKIEQTGQQQLNISAKTLDNTQGLIGRIAKEDVGSGQPSDDTTPPSVTDPEQQSSAQDSSTVEVAPVDLTPKTFQAGNIQLVEDIGNVAGQIVNNADINLTVQDSIKNNAGEIQLPELQFSGQNFENQQGKFTAKVVNINAQKIDNQKGVISASQSFDLTAQQLNNNQGRLQSGKAFNLTSTDIDNGQGQILAADALTLNSSNTNNTQGVIASVNADAQLNIKSLDNSKGEISAQNVRISGQSLKNQQGTIQAKTADLNINVDHIDNGSTQDLAGTLNAAQSIKLAAQQLQSTGQIYAGNTADLTVTQFKQHGQLAAQNKIKVQSNSIESNQNAVWAAGLGKDGKLSNADATLTLDAQNAQIAGKILSGDQINIKAAQTADLSQSESQAKNVKIETTQLNTSNAKIIADRQLDINATQTINNEKGQYSAGQVNLNTAQLDNSQGLIQHTGKNNFILNIANRIDNNAGQIISHANHTELKTSTLNSKAGEILHAGDQQLKITAQNLQGQQGKIQSNSDLQLNLGTANLDKATTAAQSINLTATELSHQQGQLIQSDADGQLQVNVAQTLDNTSGVISAAGNANVKTADLNNRSGVIQTLANQDLRIESQELKNQSGKIVVGRDAVIETAQLNNDAGTVYAAGKLGLHATQDISNQQGLIAAKQSLIIEARNLNNSKGQIQTESGDANLAIAQTLNNQTGNIQAANALNIVATQVENQAGQLLAGTDTQLDVAQLNNQTGTIYSKKQLNLNVSGGIDNSAGILVAEQNLNLNTQNLLNQAGQIRSENADLKLNIAQDIQNNTGLISAAKNLNLTAKNVISQKGKLLSGANANVQVSHLNNTEGVVYAAEQLQLLATGELNNTQGIIAAEQATDIKAGSVINAAGQIRSQQDQLKLNVQQDISNQSGEISAAKAIELNAQKVSNQKGKVIAGESLNATAQQVDNTEATIYAKDQLQLAVSDQLNNHAGTIAANQQLQIHANNINNTAGKIRSEQNQLDLNVEQKLDNQAGEIYAGRQTKINTAELNNQQGAIYSQNQLDLNAIQLNNQNGQIYSTGQSNLIVQGDIQNQQGILAAAQNLNIHSARVDNTGGTIRSENADIILNAQGPLINAQGDIYAGHNASLNSIGLDNTAGQIAAQSQLTIDTQKQQFSNQNGKIIAKAVDLKTGKLDNHAGLIQAEQSVKIDTQQNALLNNNSGSNAGILSQGSLDLLNISELENSNGYIATIGSANLIAQKINNNSGQINSQADLTIQQQLAGGRIDNAAGQIQAQKNVSLNADTINNAGTASHIVAGERLIANANKLINAQNKDSNLLGGLHAKNIEINAAELDNQTGVIRATEQGNLNIHNQLSNHSGSITSLNSLNIGTADKTLNLNNTGGELLAKNQLNLKANELVNQGKIISEGNVDLDLKQSYTHTAADQIAANGTLKLSTEQDLINQSELSAGQKIKLNAKNIQNQAGASISSNETHVIAQDTVHNQGLINGELTHIQANHVWNDGARIYGSHVAIQANSLDNKSNASGTGAVIASRGDMDLGIQILNNQSGGVVKENGRDNAWIFSAGDLNIGGSLDSDLKAQGNADRIYNGSAVIESLGDMYLGANHIQNVNENLVIALIEKYRKKVHEYGKDGEVWDSSVIRLGSSSRGLSNAILYVPEVEGGAPTREIGEDWTQYHYTQIHSEDEVQSTSPAQIIAGGNLGFTSDAEFVNKDSQVLVGLQITNGIGSISNESTALKSVDQTAPGGFSQWHSVGWNKKGTEHRHEWGREVNYQPADIIKTMPISLGIVKEYTSQQSSNPVENLNTTSVQTEIAQAQSVDLNALNTQKLNNQPLDLNAGQSIAEIGKNIQQPDLPHQIGVEANPTTEIRAEQNKIDRVEGKELNQVNNTASAVDSATDITVRTVSQDFLNLPSNALFITTKDSQAQYLVETDPAYANYKKWLSSDYMLDALGFDPALQQKRIGDGYYEQRLVQDQVAKLTGYRFLEGHSSDEEQYKALMNNGLSFAKQYQLRPGIALTEAQIAQLTSDIVWLEQKTVKLADGTTTQALVPQVYVKARVGDLKGDGTLISADSIKLDVQGDVFNSGTIAGRQAVVLNAENVELLNGRIQANQVGLNTRKDLNIVGGQIQADQAVDLNVGQNFNLESSTQHSENKIGESTFTYTGLDRVAGIYTKAPTEIKSIDTENLKTSISIRVGGDATIKGAEVLNQTGHTRIESQGDLNIGAIQTEVNNRGYADQNNYNYSKKQQDIGSVIQSVGDTRLQAENIAVKGSQVSSEQGTTILSAQQDIDISEGRKLSDMEQAYEINDKGLLSSRTEEGHVRNMRDESITSNITGKSVVLDGNNINIKGSHIVSEELTQIQAKENINITAAENQYLNQSEQSKKKSGFSASLSGGVASVGYGKSSSNTQQNNGSTILAQSAISSKGNTNIIADKDLITEAAIIHSGKDTNLIGENVSLNAGYNTTEQHSASQSKQSGISVGVTYSPIEAARSSYKESTANNQFSNSAVGQVMAQGEAVRKAGMAAATPIVVSGGKQRTQQSSNYSSTQAVVTEVAAKGNLNIIAKAGDINSQGAKISAEGDALLHARDDILLGTTQQQQTQSANSQRSGVSIDNREWTAPAGIYKDKNKGNGNIVQSVGTQVSVGGKSTLQTEKGDINIIGSTVVSQGDNTINAARDINIQSSQNSQSQQESQSSKGIGNAQISDTEKFYGYMKSQNNSQSQAVEQQRSQVGSLDGNVNIQAGNKYTQQVADVLAGKDINIKAKDIAILEDKNTGHSSQSSKDLKVGQFSRVSSPILDVINAGDQAINSKADQRTQALQGAAAVAQGYQSYSDLQGGAIAKAETGIGFKTSKSEQNSQYANSQQNLLNAGGNINLTSTEGNIHLQNTQVKAKDTINLDSAQHILLESGQSQQKAEGKNSNAGLSVGVGASVGAQTGVYIYGEAGYGKGSNHSDNNIHSQTSLDANKVSIKSKGDTTLNGAQATANRIDADVGGKLSIQSQQDRIEQDIKQTGAGARVQASLGTAWQASGNYNNSKAQGTSNSVNQQSGLFAGDGGYHVKADQVDLKGGAIVSTASKDNNNLTANSLTFSDIKNQSQYDAKSVSLSGGTSSAKDGNAANPTNNENWRNSTSFSPSLPQHESDKDSSVTRATLSEGNISIGGKKTTTTELGIHNDANTAHRTVETLPNLQEILDKQKTVADATSTIAAATRTYNQNQQKQAEAEKAAHKQQVLSQIGQSSEALEYYQNLDPVKQEEYLRQYSPEYAKASQSNQDWGMGGNKSRAVNAVTMAVTGALGGQTDMQVVANTLAPYVAQGIGQQFGHGEDKNKAAQLVSHAILGATLAYVNSGNPAAGGSAAVASEAAADYLAKQYKDNPAYQNEKGEFIPNLLPEDVKTQIRDLTAAIGAVVGGTVGDSAFEAQISGVVAQNAVENNKTSVKQDIKHALTCWGAECRQQYKDLDVAQQAAYQKGKDQAVTKFVNDLKNLPNVPKELYDALKNDPQGTAKAIYEGVKQIPGDLIDTGKTIATVNTVGDTPAEFEKLGEADMALSLNALTGLISAGSVTVVKKGGKVVIEAAKKVKLKADFDQNLNVQVNGVSGSKATTTPSGNNTTTTIQVDFDQSKIKGTPENKLVNDLQASTKYELSNGTEFKTNAHGYVEEISFKPDFGNKGVRDSRQTAVGKLGDDSDVGGHIQACVMGGTCDRYNLFPQNSNFNNSAYKVYFENVVKKANKEGKTIDNVTVKFTRNDPNSPRPDALEVRYSVNGVSQKPVNFKNEARGGK